MTDTGTSGARLDGGRIIMALGAIVLLVSLFLNWYGSPGGDGVSAWTAFEIVDLLLALIALGLLVAALGDLAPPGRLPELGTAVGAGLAVAALALVVVSLINEPPAVFGASLEIGAWLAFGAAVVIVLGTVLSSARISVTIGARERPRAGTHPDAETQTFRQP
jgi:peptidoglycan/LPS O-acetylase OafA/YrhL